MQTEQTIRLVCHTYSYRAAMLFFTRMYITYNIRKHGTLGRTASAIGLTKDGLIKQLRRVGLTYTSGNVL